MMTDPVSDLLTRVRNASMAAHSSVRIPASKIKVRIAEVLLQEGFILSYKVEEVEGRSYLKIDLKYYGRNKPVIKGIERKSRPGRRVYCGKDSLPKVLGGLGIAVLTTSKGLMTEKSAHSLGLGGEWVCSVW